MINAIISEDIQEVLGRIDQTFFSGKKVLVTGGAGFLGSYLCDTLIEANADVDCLDNFSTGLKENIEHLLNLGNFRLIEEDVCDFEGSSKYDFILHFASRASPEEYQLNPIETLIANSFGSYRILEMARKYDSQVVFASSSEVYGDPEVVPTPETYWGNVNPIGVRSCYDEGKRFGEALFMAYCREYGLGARILRIHNTYGPRLRSDGVYARALSRFVQQALENEDITVYGNGTQTRSFCYISDTIFGVLTALKSKNSVGQVINLGGSQEISILELANRVKKVAGSGSKVTFHPLPEDDPKRRCPDISKARRLLKWKPSVGLDEGLKRTIQWSAKSAK